jgi:hypothetical protein
MHDIQQKTIQMLEQLSSLAGILSPEEFTAPLDLLQGNSIGKHIRHIIEFFECLLEGIPAAEINYDLRQRNLRIENEPDFCLARIKILQSGISEMVDAPMILKADFGSGIQEFQTSVFRELAFSMDHCIHHLALIRIGLRERLPELALVEDFGVAFSTLRFLENQKS